MNRWRLVLVDEDENTELTNSELISIEIILRMNMGLPHDEDNVYFRAWEKLLPKVNFAHKLMDQETLE